MESEIKKEFDNSVNTMTTIITAIETGNIIAMKYTKDINTSGIRQVLPHNIYWNKDDSKVMLDAYQIQGDSKTGTKSFKQFDTKFIESIIILDDKFDIQEGYNSESDRYNKSILGITE